MILEPSGRRRSGFPVGIVAAVSLALIAAGAGVWYLNQPRENANQPPVLTPEAKEYVKNLKLSEVQLKATDSAMARALVEIIGNITNNGDRNLKLVELTCIFYDPYNQVVLRERVPIVRSRTGSLAPGETKPFRMPFDSLPDSWNQGMPQLVIAQIQFE